MFKSVLIANRGEIAVRITRTLRAMGVRVIVVASIPDRRSLAVRSADDWVLLEGYSAAETYLDQDAVIAAAKAKGCEAIHPGYGFLAENAEFAERCAREGLFFIGPPPAVLRLLGDKSAARQLAVANSVPVIPGYDGDSAHGPLTEAAASIGFPVMVKARAGGGGRGMRVVRTADDLPEALDSASREAEAAFGDGSLLLEKLVENVHHVEVQVLADSHGNVIHLGERDCSVQRRHQKLIEEAPSPVVDDALRARLTGDALRLARAAGYVNAGTFEFLVGEPGDDAQRPYWFIEANPRLQVEHPVTEAITGLDIVELQLRIAAGEELPIAQGDVTFTGHAIELRINAEDPANDFAPSSGRLTELWTPVLAGQRLDRGYEPGDEVPSHYDSLLAKLIVPGSDRADAIETAVERTIVAVSGVGSNASLLSAIVGSEDFSDGDCTTDWLETFLPGLAMPVSAWAAAAAAIVIGASEYVSSPFARSARWLGAGGSRFWLASGEQVTEFVVDEVTEAARELEVVVGRESVVCDVRGLGPSGGSIIVRNDEFLVTLILSEEALLGVQVENGNRRWHFNPAPPPPLPRRAIAATAGAAAITAPLAGTIGTVVVAAGDDVEAGDLLATLEAMKMEHRIVAPSAGKVVAVHVAPGEQVPSGHLMLELQ